MNWIASKNLASSVDTNDMIDRLSDLPLIQNQVKNFITV